MKKVEFINDSLYHIYNRGVEKRTIFPDEKDYYRFIHNLYEFNNKNSVINLGQRLQQSNRGETSITLSQRDSFVEIICFCLMPNHFHLILKQLKHGGISRFLQKLGTGYTMYFNKKYDRNGVLFQGTFKAIHVDKDEYFLPLSYYIHLNPLELAIPKWKERGIQDWEIVNKFLKEYKWSSYLDYIGKQNFPSLINKDFLLDYFDGREKNYQRNIMEWVMGDFEEKEKLSRFRLD
ncbi:MAG: transposase [bacterium]